MNFDLKTVSGFIAIGAILLYIVHVLPLKAALITGGIGAAGAVFLPSSESS